MVYTWGQIVDREGEIPQAFKSVDEKKYKKVAHGVYVDDFEFISELEQLFARYPRATLTMQSAFDYYGLSDYIPDKYYLATPYNAHPIDNSKVQQSYIDEEAMQVSRVKLPTHYGFIYIFDKERMLIELFRLKAKIPHPYFMELVSSYGSLKANDEISLAKVSKYCQKLSRGERILKDIQEMI